MDKIIAAMMSLLTTLSLFFGTLGSDTYVKSTGLKEAINALINKNEITETEYKGKISSSKWDSSMEYSIDDTIVLKKEKGKDFVILNITDTHFADYDYRAFTAFDVEAKIKVAGAVVVKNNDNDNDNDNENSSRVYWNTR